MLTFSHSDLPLTVSLHMRVCMCTYTQIKQTHYAYHVCLYMYMYTYVKVELFKSQHSGLILDSILIWNYQFRRGVLISFNGEWCLKTII